MKAVAETRIVVCGAGALGGNIVDGMARCGFKDIAVIDFDRVTEANLCTQPYFSVDCGTKKVSALCNLVESATGVCIDIYDRRLDAMNVRKLLVGELVVDAFDNSESRKVVRDYCLEKKVPCLHAGMGDGYSEVVWNERYTVPKDRPGVDPCDVPLARNLAVITAAIVVETVIGFIATGERKDRSFTIRDMKIS
jgi:molybdopterin/thiamine biosynthesis adenylyltransferase